MPLGIKKSNSAGTTFEPKFVFLFRFCFDYYIETRKIPFEMLTFVAPVSTIFKKIIADKDSCASLAFTSPFVVNYMGCSLSLKPADLLQKQLVVRAYFRCYTVRCGVNVLGKGFKLTLNVLNLKNFSLQFVNDFR